MLTPILAAAALLLAVTGPAGAADDPAPPPGLAIEARALMAGHVRPGAWAAINVIVTNDGPALSGELRVRAPQQGRSVYSLPVELPGTSRQAYTLYAQPPLFGTRLHVDLVSNGQRVLSADVAVKSHDAYAPIVAVLAERPEGLLPGVNAGLPRTTSSSVITITAADLPPRVHAWSAIDRLIWQDVDPRTLAAEQLEALRLWVSAGGQLVVVGGTTGIATVSGFPPDLLPFMPTTTIDVPTAHLLPLVGAVPPAVTSAPAMAGTLRAGTAWAGSGERVIAAQASLGQGTVALVGINPAEPWLAGEAGNALWRRLLPAAAGANVNVLGIGDDSQLVGVLNSLPSIDLPPIEQLFLLLFAYITLIGPVNYVVLRRLDRREWAWVTMPALVAVFAVGSYGMGASLKGSDVIVNEVAIVRAGENSDRGLGLVYVGVFSPSRRNFDVRIDQPALLTTPLTEYATGQAPQPLDVITGESARLRNFEVGFGLLRSFRAETTTAAPAIESNLRLSRGRLEGTVTNRSAAALDHVAVAYGGGAAVLDTLEAGETASVVIDTATPLPAYQLPERIFGSVFPVEQAQARTAYVRRTVVDMVANRGNGLALASAVTPTLIGWQSGAVLDVELAGERPNRVGDSLYIVPLTMSLDREVVFNDQTMLQTVLENNAGEGFAEGKSYYMSRGAMVIEMRPATFNGRLDPRALQLALTQDSANGIGQPGTPLVPLPDAEQPDQDDPVGTAEEPGGGEFFARLPDVQLFDHGAGLWYEFPAFTIGRTYTIGQPERFVDGGGRVLARLVNRGDVNEQSYFSLLVRLEGVIE